MTPRATYRLQLRREFNFDRARAIVPYLARLGISHIYSSPILAARPGSAHGYDTVDHAHVSDELGGEDAFRALAAELKTHGMGLIVDIVPNHMAAATQNRWWMDVLEHGRASGYARCFDIDWEPPDPTLKNRVLLPVLAAPLADTLANDEIAVVQDEECGKVVLAYAGHRFPLRPEDSRAVSAEAPAGLRQPEKLQAVLDRQHYRLAWWRTAGDLINWRRFFDINDLIALRMEDDWVFEAVHAKPLALYEEGAIDGFRIDHIDGLADPRSYCRKLRARLDALRPGGYLVVEKILAPGEALPRDWGVDGTTGYDFMNDASAVLHDAAGADPLAFAWAEISGRTSDFHAEERAARRELLVSKFHGAFEGAARAFFATVLSAARDMTKGGFERALQCLLEELRIYRTYVTENIDSPGPLFESAVERALSGMTQNDAAALQDVVGLIRTRDNGQTELQLTALRRFNQLAASLAAKAVEDTAFYRYGTLISRNEVGSNPAEISLAPDEYHLRAHARLHDAPLLATATHDHKRGEDARMRLAVLSEIAAEWLTTVAGWFELNAPIRDGRLDRGDEYQLYQTLIGAWPSDLDWRDGQRLKNFVERIINWQLKSLHEAKLHSSWGNPDAAYELASAQFVRRLFDPVRSSEFLRSFTVFMGRIAPAAALNGLVQSTLRCTSPGVPDLYQGTEFWDFSLVDPDNRRPVDFATRAAALGRECAMAELMQNWRSGEIKLHLIANLLALRSRHVECFRHGDYVPLKAEGPRHENIICFLRRHGSTSILVLVPRLCAQACFKAGSPHPDHSFWGDTVVPLPVEHGDGIWRSLFDADAPKFAPNEISCAETLRGFPVAILVRN